MVMVFVNIGKDSNNKKVVIKIDYINNGILFNVILGVCMLNIVVIKFIVFKIEDILVKWRLKIVMFIVFLEWVWMFVRGGYIVYLVFVFCLIKVEFNNNIKVGGNN